MLQGEVPKDDLAFGSIVLAGFLVFVFLFGWQISRFKNRRFARAWEPLRPMIGGRVVSDGGGAATSWLAGNYNGRAVCASMIPGRNRYSGESGTRFDYFDVALPGTPGKADWALREGKIYAGKALDQRLRDAGLMAMLAPIGQADVVYERSQSKLTLVQEPHSGWIPAPAHFEAQIKMLLRLEQLNAAVN